MKRGKNSGWIMVGVVGAQLIIMLIYLLLMINRGKSFNTVRIENSEFIYASEGLEQPRPDYLAENQIEGLVDNGLSRRIVTPEVSIPKGVYQVDVDYESTVPVRSTTGVWIAAYDDGFYPYAESEQAFLTCGSTHAIFLIHARDNTSVKIRAIMDEDCYFNISLSTVTVSRLGMRSIFPSLIVLFVVFLFLDLLILIFGFRSSKISRYCQDNALLLIGLFATLILACSPLFAGRLLKGFDTKFHMYRIFCISQGMLSGQVPTYIYPEFINNYGYGLGLFYPDLLLYIPAFLYRIGFTMESVYKFFIFLINFLTILISFYSFKKIARDNEKIGFVGMLVYVFALPRIAAVFSRGALGAAGCYAFAPIFALGLIRLFDLDTDEEHMINPCIYLAVGMSGMLATHVLGSMLAVLFAVIFVVFYPKKLASKRVWAEIIKGAGLAALISAWFLVPFLTSYFTVKLGVSDDEVFIYDHASLPAQLFSNHYEISADVQADLHGMYRDMPVTMGPASFFILLFAFMVFTPALRKYTSDRTKILLKLILCCCLLSLWLASTFFPYRWLYLHWNSFYNAVSQFQYNYRFLGVSTLAVATIVVLFLSDLGKSEIKKSIFVVGTVAVAAVFLFQGLDMINAYSNEMPQFEDVDRFRNLGFSALYNAEFLPLGFDLDDCESVVDVSALEAEGGSFSLVGQNGISLSGIVVNPSDKDIAVIFPRVYYPGFVVKTDAGTLNTSCSDNYKVKAIIPSGYSGQITLNYRAALPWHFAWFESFAAMIVLTLFCYKKVKNHA